MFCIRYLKLFWVYNQNHGEKTDSPSIKIHVNKIENRITFKIKTGYYLEVSMPETMNIFGSTKNKLIKNKNSENISHL